ncbi:CoA transferase [Nocardiopsis sp. CNT312]|uniref:CoA transferase n=1 Tax=Nocardiopsis sp. CNT312 TaxID=1137268 RepID=UPI00048A48F6|nr:CoA transferase [Nocardiopsis sp. CNT312]
MTDTYDVATARAWEAVGGAADLAAGVSYRGAGDVLPAVLPVRALARATVGACSLAAAELLAVRGGVPVPRVRVEEGAVATAFTSERHLAVEGRVSDPFAPLSGFWRTADGWVRTHANYPHHRARLLSALGVGGAEPVERFAGAVAELGAREVQERVYAAGGLAVAVASGPVPGGLPLAEVEVADGVGVRRLAPAALPAAGVRVLDLTRVIAGPVATRTLALLGADVLRVDPPGLAEDARSHIDTGQGKRSTVLDLDSAEGREALWALLESADVVVAGYRPGALERRGLVAEELVARCPGLVVARLCAWGWSGPWAGRRGFDSLVQAACGIAAVEGGPGGRPGVLPAQALDHGTGYLMAAGVLRALTDRQDDGRGRLLRFSLAGTAHWLLHGIAPVRAGSGGYEVADWLAEASSPYGRLRYALPPLGYAGVPVDWAAPCRRWGGDPAVWL